MASLTTNLVAFDGASTPVSHTFVGKSVSKNGDELVAVYREQNTGVPEYAQGQVTLKLKRMSSGVYRVSTRVEIPVMESVGAQNAAGYTAPPKVAYTDTVEAIGYFHERATIEGRRRVRQLAVNILNGVETSVTPVTTKAPGELFDLLNVPA